MKYAGRQLYVSTNGKVVIPPNILKKIGIERSSLIEFTLTEGSITLKKKTYTCLVTGETNDDVKELLPGIYLSGEGMRILLEELNRKV